MAHNKQMGIIKPIDTGAAADHNHDSRYYTESEVENKLSNKSSVGHSHSEYALRSHSHTEYASSDHNHDGTYAPYTHTHSGYATSGHTHSNYVTKAQHNALVDDIQQILTFISGMVPAGTIMWFKTNPDSRYWTLYTPLVGRYPLGTADTAEAGTTIAAGLPNITGTLNQSGAIWSDSTGALGHTDLKGKVRDDVVDSSGYREMSFDASISNSIYGNSDTVTPPSVKLLPFMRNSVSPQLSLSPTI